MIDMRTSATMELAALMQALAVLNNHRGMGFDCTGTTEKKMWDRYNWLIEFLGLGL